MRRMIFGGLLGLLLFGMPGTGCITAGEKSTLTWLKFDEAMLKARQENKKVLIDVYTTWCGWCKKMDADTYSDTLLAPYLSRHFVLVKLNAESDAALNYKGEASTEQGLAGSFGVNGYPTTIFLTSAGEPITATPGYMDAATFRTLASFIGEDYYLTMKYDEYAKAQQK